MNFAVSRQNTVKWKALIMTIINVGARNISFMYQLKSDFLTWSPAAESNACFRDIQFSEKTWCVASVRLFVFSILGPPHSLND